MRQTITGDRAMLLAAVRSEDALVTLTVPQIRQVLEPRVRDVTGHRLAPIAEWSQPRYWLDGRFVALTLLVDKGEEVAGDRWVAREERCDDLGALLTNVDDPALVVLGPPGCGESTLLRPVDLQMAVAALPVHCTARLHPSRRARHRRRRFPWCGPWCGALVRSTDDARQTMYNGATDTQRSDP
jgi:hypothetical protein